MAPDPTSSRSPPDAREPFVLLLWAGGGDGGTLPPPAFWRVAAALGDALAQVGRLDVETAMEPALDPRLLASFGLRGDSERALRSLAKRLPRPLRVVAMVSPQIARWPAEEIAFFDEFAATVAELAGRPVGRLAAGEEAEEAFRPGLLLLPRRSLDRTMPISGLDARVLRVLRELDLPSDRVVAALSGAPGTGWRGLARSRRPRLEMDRFEIEHDRGATRLAVAGWVAARPAIRTVVVRVGSRRYAVPVDRERPDVATVHPWLADLRCGFAFAHTPQDLPPGPLPVRIERLDGTVLRDLGEIEIPPASPGTAPPAAAPAPALAVDAATLFESGGRGRLRVEGTVDATAAPECVRIRFGGQVVYDADPAAVLGASAGAGRRRFGIDLEIGLPRRSRPLRIELVRRQEVTAAWEGLPERKAGEASREARSRELARLERSGRSWLWGDLALSGDVADALPQDAIELTLDGREAATFPIADDGRFEVRAEIEPGLHAAEVALRPERSEGPAVRRFEVVARAAAPPREWEPRLERVLRAAAEVAPAWSGVEAGGLARRLARREPASVADLDRLLARLAEALSGHAGRRTDALPALPEHPLRVLFATSEVPWPGHGGGVAVSNLLRVLGERHEITLLHPVHPGAEGLSEVVRPFVREILTVPRGWNEPSPLLAHRVPERFQRTYSPALAGALAAEALGGGYDVVNLEFDAMALHAPERPLAPTLGVMIESESFARLAETPERFADLDSAAAAFTGLVAALAYDTEIVARRFPTLATLTGPEADWLARFLPGRSIAVQPIAIDTAGLAAGAQRGERATAPSFVFVGTFRHPPNRQAAAEIVDRIAPALRASRPDARVLLIGADPPAELVDRAATTGVECLGWIDDLPARLGSATAFVAPIHSGAGMRVKLLEAMACGCPVVTTALGMSGIAAIPDEHFLRAETSEETVAAALRLADDRQLAERLRSAARQLVAATHALEVQGERRERLWELARSGWRAEPR